MTKASQIVNVPYFVADAMLGTGLEEWGELSNMAWVWEPLTHGSSRHHMRQRGTDYFVVSVYAIASERTEIVLDLVSFNEFLKRATTPMANTDHLTIPALDTVSELMKKGTDAAQATLSIFCEVIVDEAANRQGAITQMVRELGVFLPDPKRPGPQPAHYTRWAREQARAGRTIDEMLDEYMRMRGEDPDDQEQRKRLRDTLRRTVRRAQR